LGAGLRRNEALSAGPENILIKKRDGDEDYLLEVESGKGGIDRIIPISDSIHDPLEHYLQKQGRDIRSQEESPILISRKNQSLSEPQFNRVIRGLVDRAGIGRSITPHNLRDTFATQMLKTGVPIHVVSRWLGHSSIRTTDKRYGYFDDEDFPNEFNFNDFT
jgi:integrase/recombinase XerD